MTPDDSRSLKFWRERVSGHLPITTDFLTAMIDASDDNGMFSVEALLGAVLGTFIDLEGEVWKLRRELESRG